ncbi:hypothetical protein PYCC9005_000505 [Savitreella phatthalungensis]
MGDDERSLADWHSYPPTFPSQHFPPPPATPESIISSSNDDALRRCLARCTHPFTKPLTSFVGLSWNDCVFFVYGIPPPITPTHPQPWEAHLVRAAQHPQQRLDLLVRSPAALLAYRAWRSSLPPIPTTTPRTPIPEWVKGLPAVAAFVIVRRLRWHGPIGVGGQGRGFVKMPRNALDREATPTTTTHEYAILPNDFPYTFDHRDHITHLVVWVRGAPHADVPDDAGGDRVDGQDWLEWFAHKYVLGSVDGVAGDRERRCCVFANPPGLKSIAEVDHFHVLVRGLTSTQIAAVVVSDDE